MAGRNGCIYYTYLIVMGGFGLSTEGVELPNPSVVGLNYGYMGSQSLLPSTVVDLLYENGISKVKLYGTGDQILSAFVDTSIEVITAIPNQELKLINSTRDAMNWFRRNLKPFMSDVDIKFIIVGNEPFSTVFNNQTYFNVVEILKYFHEAIRELGYERQIKLSMTHFTDVLDSSTTNKPSEGQFRKNILKPMQQVIRYLNLIGAPIMLNIYPLYNIQEHKWPLEFAFDDNQSNFTIKDGDITYTNVFDAIYDSFVSAVSKAGAPEMKIIVGQIGWATDGSPDANVVNAERFYKGYLKKMASKKGTPLRPGKIESYIYNILDENKLYLTRGPFQRHWGIYKYDGYPKFKIDFTGQGRDVYPVPATTLVYLPGRWCIFNGNTGNMTKVMENFNYACNKSDCSSLAYGGSCNNLDFNGNVSYAFNMYFQMKSQRLNEEVCQFEGLGQVTTNNVSRGECLFPLQIVSAAPARHQLAFFIFLPLIFLLFEHLINTTD